MKTLVKVLSNPISGAKSYYRGHLIVWNGIQWLFADNGDALPSHGGKSRPCKKCGAEMSENEPDKCLGELNGVDNACCGHGIKSQSYIRFENGLTINNFKMEPQQ